MNILIVDDDRLNLEMIGAFCRAQGFNVVTAMNGLEAIEKFSSNPTDLVLMDVIMPGMDGYKTTEKIKEMSGSHWVPVILIYCSRKKLPKSYRWHFMWRGGLSVQTGQPDTLKRED